MSESYTPSATAPTFPLTLPLDGEVINHTNLIDGMIKPALDYTKSVIATATANMASLAKQTASSGDTLIGVLTYAGRFLTLPTGTLRTVLQYVANTAITDGASQAITPSATTYTADYATARNFHVFSPSDPALIVTLKSTSPAPPEGAEMTISAFAVTNLQYVSVEREGGGQIIQMTGTGSGANFGFGRFKNIGGTWRLMDATGIVSINAP